MSLLNLGKNLKRKIEKIANVDKKIKDTAKEVLTAVAFGTPVDTSKALSNWKVSVGVPDESVREAFSEGIDGSSQGASLSSVLNKGLQVIESRKPGQPIFIQNNVDYIMDLENGKSNKGEGFIRAALIRGRRVASK